MLLRVDPSTNTLLHVHHRRHVTAQRGRHGQGSDKTGASGKDEIVPVPPGTIVRDAETGAVLGDLVEPGEEIVVARGGRGGRGNARFATSTNRAPRRADPGEPGEEREIELELRLLADVGLVGLPNAGKSTLLSVLSAARPKIADYPFTTLEPYLGVVRAPDDETRTTVLADIPGLIEGAHEGAGLGHRFLKHVSRCRVLLLLVDLAGEDELARSVNTVRSELVAYDEDLRERPWVLVGTKLDAVGDDEPRVAELEACARAHRVSAVAISAVTGRGLPELLGELFRSRGG